MIESAFEGRYARGTPKPDEARAAVAAWHMVSGGGTLPDRVVALHEDPAKSGAYRLLWTSAARSVVAKQGVPAQVRYEAKVYEMLARLPVRVPYLLGMVESDAAGDGWLFIEDAGDDALDFDRREHRVLAAQWLATAHASVQRSCTTIDLADRSPLHYLRMLQTTQERLCQGQGYDRVTTSGRKQALRVAIALGRLERVWGVVEHDASALPPTLVHADFVSKNLRVARKHPRGPITLLPIDWGAAGVGSPAIDLRNVHLPSYRAALGMNAIAPAALQRVSRAGHVFWLVLLVTWAEQALDTPWPERALHVQLPAYERWLNDLSATFEEELR